ncbi:MAG: bifunctional folylpolyglutamate synthase/dihydrofolate synthase [Betaproteobacteria bacterium RIFCSPLOWO2_12_FULL_62_13b]|nr:MAG: bifunctional folylpolyglutamate synthase/dihydrofolate synthase [Betaproteobacteria bacterium RIFCSPLOWO2_12_FULL_62_13b]
MSTLNSHVTRDLAGWLAYIEQQHTQSIALGLERVARVRDAMGLRPAVPVVTVAGTNGKGSTCAMLEAVLSAAGYRVGLYTSPHLLRYNERVRIAGREADDRALVSAFARVEAARTEKAGNIRLTYFEFGTLVAVDLFLRSAVDVLVLEVGLGGRLDAVNAFDADCGIVTSIGLDHMDYLGATREAIGREKAGIFRAGKPAVLADPAPPASVRAHAQAIGARLLRIGHEFGYQAEGDQWLFWGPAGRKSGLPYPALRGRTQLLNASAAFAALDTLQQRLPVSMQHLRRGLAEAELRGRFQVLPGRPVVVLDVGHNPQAAAVLSDNLSDMGLYSDTWAVFGMLRDKDIAGVARLLAKRINHWMVCTLPPPRGAQAADLAQALRQAGVFAVREFENPALAYAAACSEADDNDRIVVFGSFHTVANILAAREH